MRLKVGVLISGRGSNLAALARAAEAPDYPAEIVVVVANRADAAGLALGGGADAVVVDHRVYASREAHEQAIDAVLRAHEVRVVCLAGYMRRLTPWLVERWAGRMLNIHPSLLPSFPGLNTHARALAAGAGRHGCTVHVVTEGVDEGPVIAQAEVPVLAGDTEVTLAARVLKQEHILYPKALADFVRALK